MNYIANHAYTKKWQNLFLVLNGTGMRIGEALALQWEDLDFDQNIIRIERTILYVTKEKKTFPEIHQTKTPSSMRTVPMSETVKMLFLQKEIIKKKPDLNAALRSTVLVILFLSARTGNPEAASTLTWL